VRDFQLGSVAPVVRWLQLVQFLQFQLHLFQLHLLRPFPLLFGRKRVRKMTVTPFACNLSAASPGDLLALLVTGSSLWLVAAAAVLVSARPQSWSGTVEPKWKVALSVQRPADSLRRC